MIEEVENLIAEGIPVFKLNFFGLEYRYITDYLQGQLGYEEMFERLQIAIYQYSKRQMTWFRRMEKSGLKINWLDGNLALNDKLNILFNNMNK
jgi:tRNA dimethylallyltransferase